MNSQFTSVSIGRGSNAGATELAIFTSIIVAATATAKTRITKTSIKTITIR